MHELIFDEYSALEAEYTQYIKIHKLTRAYRNHYFVMTDDSPVFSSAAKAFASVKPKASRKIPVDHTEVTMETAHSFPTPRKNRKDRALFVAFADTLEAKYADEAFADKFIDALTAFCRKAKAYKDSRCAVCMTVPMPQSLEGGITKLAEREYLAYLAAQTDANSKTAQRIVDLCRDLCGKEGIDVVLYMCDNLIAPDCSSISFDGLDLVGMVKEAISTKEVTITDEDYASYFGISYIRDIYTAILHGSRITKKGNIYNLSTHNVCKADLKLALANAHKDKFALKCSRTTLGEPNHTGFDQRKFYNSWPAGSHAEVMTVEEIMYRLANIELDIEYDMSRMLTDYNGHLGRIRSIGLMILKEFDAICRRNGIEYFIAAGTLLGAIRHGDMIPWDDDYDIGMTRENYDKLCKILTKELPDKFVFSHPGNGSKSEYRIDKVRLRDTFYVTQYFSQFEMPNGMFMDIFVYDKTSNKTSKQWRHILISNAFGLAISTKWTKTARPGHHYKISKFLLPFTKIVPMSLLHKMDRAFARKYRRSKKSKFAMDTVGLNINKGALPLEGVTGTQDFDYLGMKVLIPANYEAYLRHFYGKNYMSLPPVSSRVSGHNFTRLDFGEYLYSDEYTGLIPHCDDRGELYEKPVK